MRRRLDGQQIAHILDAYDAQVDALIGVCNGDVRSALRALILANEYLEMELAALLAEAEHGTIQHFRAPATRLIH